MGGLSAGKTEYSELYEVKSFDTDWYQELRPSAMLRYFQDISSCHLGCFGMSYNELLDDGVVFLLTAVTLRVNRPVQLREKVTVTTWHRGVRGAQFIRNTEICAGSGERLVECTADWVIVDPATHRIKRPRDYEKIQLVPPQPDKILYGAERVVLHCPEEMEPVERRPIRYSDIDYNHHLNNTRYADIITDSLANDFAAGKRLHELRLVFSGEAALGDVLTVSRKNMDDEGNRVLFRAVHDRGRCFEAEVRLTKR